VPKRSPKYRINPATSASAKKTTDNFKTMVEVAVENQKPVRIGVNWVSLDQQLLTRMMDENTRRPEAEQREARDITMDAMVVSALRSAEIAEKAGLRRDQIILSAKVSGVQDLVDVYRDLASRCDYALHLGLTEAGMGAKGIVASAAGIECCCNLVSATLSAYRSPRLPAAIARRSHGGAADPAVARHPQLYAAGHGLSGMRAHYFNLLPGDGTADPNLSA